MNWSKQNWIKIGLIVLVLGISIFIKEWRNDSPAVVSNVSPSSDEKIDELVARVREMYTDSNTATIAEIQDRKMADYITDIILVRCPFYEPSGAIYRMCLDDLMKRAESEYKGSELALEVIRNRCLSFANDYGGLETGEMYANCMTYNLSECASEMLTQSQYLKNEKLSEEFTFEKYKTSDILSATPADLDINSNPSARMFRTMIRQDLEKEGVNFAGHYSITDVGMTGWGDNYWIVDRENGKAYTFPYLPYSLDFRTNSNLIIMNSKSAIKEASESGGGCGNIGALDIRYPDLRPFYFLWENNELKLLGPTDIEPPVNMFWGKMQISSMPS